MRILVLPDIHGRDFWREPCSHPDEYDRIIFLGDYVDPYPKEKISPDYALKGLRDIVDFARDNDKVTLLLGNHDLGYIDPGICECRRSYKNYYDLRNILSDGMFKLATMEEITAPGEIDKTVNVAKTYIFTHAGICRTWLEMMGDCMDMCFLTKPAECLHMLNDMYSHMNPHFMQWLSVVSRYRGGYYKAGSMVWADIREYDYMENPFGDDVIQICGHTKLLGDLAKVENYIYCIDSSQPFIVDENGLRKLYNTDNE